METKETSVAYMVGVMIGLLIIAAFFGLMAGMAVVVFRGFTGI